MVIKNKKDLIGGIVLGSGPAADHIIDYLHANFPKLIVCQITQNYKSKHLKRKDKYVRIKSLLLEKIKSKLPTSFEVKFVINRFDSYIAMHGFLCEHYQVLGPSLESVNIFKNKGSFSTFMKENKLEKYRPWSKVLTKTQLFKLLQKKPGKYILKPLHGSKSRGIKEVLDEASAEEFFSDLRKWETSKKYKRAKTDKKRKILIEEKIEGNQVTCTGFVNSKGKLTILSYEDVKTAKDFEMKSWQLVTRTTPSKTPIEIQKKIEMLLKKIIKKSGLRSSFIYPEFIIANKNQINLIELNVRVGGYRSEMLYYSAGVDINAWVIELAMNGDIKTKSIFQDKSVTATEVWRDESGLVKNIEIPDQKEIVGLEINFKNQKKYNAPPKGDIPLAKFFVSTKDENSQELADKILAKVKVEFM